MNNHIARIRPYPSDDLQRIKSNLSPSSSYLGDDVFVWEAEISSDRLDAYFTHMCPSSLQNFVGDLKKGVSFQDSHARNRLGYGQSLNGEYLNVPTARIIGTFYTVPGIKFNANSFQSTDDFIRAVQAGIVRDVSIGFYGGVYICDLCLAPYLNCSHWAGMEYERDGDRVVCTVAIENANLAEVSVVYDGATPGAVILKAQEHARAGMLPPQTLYDLQLRYRVELPTTQTKRGIEVVNKPEEVNKPETDAGAAAEIEQLKMEVDRLTPLANAGTAYLTKLQEELIAEGIRSQGENFPIEIYQILAQRLSPEQINDLCHSFRHQAEQRLPGGRFTQPRRQTTSTSKSPSAIPREAYRS